MPKPIVLVLGAGGNIGAHLTTKFTNENYSIALASRTLTPGLTPQNHLHIKIDLTNPLSLPSAFEKTHAAFGIPNIVIYNAAIMRPPPNPASMFSISVQDMISDINLMTVSAYAAAQETVKGWESLPKGEGGERVFIYTGNMLNKTVLGSAFVLTLGVGKAGAAYWIGSASMLYAEKGYKFYYADQHLPDGGPMGTDVSGPAAAEFYWKLVTEDAEVPWDATFVEGKGYVDFSALEK